MEELNKEIIENKINNIMKDMNDYMLYKSLKLNSEKTEILIFRKKRNEQNMICPKSFNINNNIIETKENIKILGCIMDKNLSLKNQITVHSKEM